MVGTGASPCLSHQRGKPPLPALGHRSPTLAGAPRWSPGADLLHPSKNADSRSPLGPQQARQALSGPGGGGGGEMISAQRSPVPDGLGQFCPRAGFSGDQEAKGGLKVGERPAGGGSMNRTECRKTEPATQTEVSLKTQKCCPTGPLRPCPG